MFRAKETGMVGRGKDVSDKEILSAMQSISGPFVTSSELVEELPIGQNQVNNRLQTLYEKKLVDYKSVGRGNGWWITKRGKQFLAGEFGEGDNVTDSS